jgi:hypothetical protein
VIHQNGKPIRNYRAKSFEKGTHAIVQNGIARFGHKDAIRDFNAGMMEKIQTKGDISFDSELYLRRLSEFAVTPPDDLIKMWKIKDKIGREEKQALEEIINTRSIDPEAEPENTGEELDPEYNDEAYEQAVSIYTAWSKDKIKTVNANRGQLTKEERDALDHIISKKNIKIS